MPYVLLILGLFLGLLGLYRFVVNATVSQIKALLVTVVIAAIGIAVFFLAVTGRLPAAIALLVALVPIATTLLRKRKAKDGPELQGTQNKEPSTGPMSRQEALEILGLDEPASPEDVKTAYKRLIKKSHPDQEGSAWIAAKLNQARDRLLKE